MKLSNLPGWQAQAARQKAPLRGEPVGSGNSLQEVLDTVREEATRLMNDAPQGSLSYSLVELADALKGLLPKAAPAAPAKAAAPAAPAAPAATAKGPEPAGRATYTVVGGDTLSGIAQKTLGDGSRWREIFELNRDQLSDPNRIFPGMSLKLPGGTAATPRPAAGGLYTVRSGDTLGGIAQKTLGGASRWREIFELNRDQLSDPNLIFPGMTLKLPGGVPAAQAPAPKPPAATPAPAAGLSYTVVGGDTLGGIAQRTLGAASRWREIFALNRDKISDPNRIYPGLVLRLPNGAHTPAPSLPSGASPSMPGGFNFPLNADQIAAALHAPVENVRRYWPLVAEACKSLGLTDTNTVIAILATISVEVGSFKPIPEYASGAAYEGRSDLGNIHRGDGVRYKGRGFIQLTGRANYRTYGRELGIDLEGNPDLALDPLVAAKVMALYFKNRNLDDRAREGDWRAVRRGVNGGYNGWDTFYGAVTRLQGAVRSEIGGGGNSAPSQAPFWRVALNWLRDRFKR